MLKNYFTIAWRNIRKNGLYSVINITGLSVGIAFTLLIAAFIWSESQVNRGLKDADRQYILQSRWKVPNMGAEITTLGPLSKALQEQYPQLVAHSLRMDGISSNVSSAPDKHFRGSILLADSSVLTMYGFNMLGGDARTALQAPFSVVLTADAAQQYFGTTQAVGKTLEIENFSGDRKPFQVTGVIEVPAKNSVSYIASPEGNGIFISLHHIDYFGRFSVDDWRNQYTLGYVTLQPGATPEALAKAMQQLVKAHAAPQVAANLEPYAMPLREFYLNENRGLVRKMLYALSCIAVFILLMAIVNFVNMSVSRSASRMKEIGVRKVMGGLRRQLVAQFLTESTVLVMLATALALALCVPLRNWFGQLVGTPLPPLSAFPASFALIPLLLALVIGLLAGVYPAFVLTRLRSADSLKGKLSAVKDHVFLRKGLVAFQFGTAIIVLVCAIVVSQQIKLFFSGNLGYNKDYVVSAQVPRDWSKKGVQHMLGVRDQLASLPQVRNASLSYEIPNGNNSGAFSVFRQGMDSTSAVNVEMLQTDEKYLSTYNIPLAAGSFFRDANDTTRVVINAKLAASLGWKDPSEAVGAMIRVPGNPTPIPVAGVVRDFHFSSMHEAISPTVFVPVAVNTSYRYLSLQLKPGAATDAIAAVEAKWAELMPGTPFAYSFMDDSLAKLYRTELQLKKAFYTATGISLLIVLLGVLGLVSLSVQKRTKEIGVRKVLGASVQGIVGLFIKEFLLIIGIATLVACPLAWFFMRSWLDNYVYHVDMTAQPFLLTAVTLGLLTSLLIVLQTLRTALENPSKSLRSE
ncbi:ABC transporter permease [Chitinophaga lutea]